MTTAPKTKNWGWIDQPPSRLSIAIYDGEIVIGRARGLDFEALQLRLHPATSRVAKIPATFGAFDVLALGSSDLRSLPQRERRTRLN